MTRLPTLDEAADATFDRQGLEQDRRERRRERLKGEGWSETAIGAKSEEGLHGLIWSWGQQKDPYALGLTGMFPPALPNPQGGRKRTREKVWRHEG